MRFHEAIQGVYFEDLDALGVLHNSRYLLLLERTIGAFWQRIGWAHVTDFRTHPDALHLVRANHIAYDRPVTGVGDVRVRVWIEKLGRTSLTFGFRVLPLDQDVDHANGSRVLVCVDPETRRPAPWSATFRAKVAPYVNEGTGAADG